MAKVKCFQLIKIRIKTDCEDLVEKLCDLLCEEFAGADWEWCIDNHEEDSYEINGTEYAEGNFYRGKMWTSNGDGYPDEWDVDFEVYEDDVNDLIAKFEEDIPEEHKFDWSSRFDIESYGDYYY